MLLNVILHDHRQPMAYLGSLKEVEDDSLTLIKSFKEI